MKSKTQSLADFVKAYKPKRGPDCMTCESPYAEQINDSARRGVKVSTIAAWLESIGANLSAHSVKNHLVNRHWERKAARA